MLFWNGNTCTLREVVVAMLMAAGVLVLPEAKNSIVNIYQDIDRAWEEQEQKQEMEEEEPGRVL